MAKNITPQKKVKRTSTASPVDRKRSLAAKKGAATRALNRELAAKRTLRLHHKLLAGGAIAAVLVFTFFGVKSQLDAFAAVTKTAGTFTGIAGKCLDNYKDKGANHNLVDLYTCNGSEAQRWVVTTDPMIKAAVGSNTYCLDTPGNSKKTGVQVQLYSCNGTAAQKFKVSGSTIVSQTTGFCITVKNGATSNKTALTMQKCNGSASQKWSYKGSCISGQPCASTGSGSTSGSDSGGSTGGSGSPSGSSTGSGSGSTSVGSNGVTYGTPEHPFSAKSPWNTPIPSNPAIDANSAAIVSNVLNNKSLILNMILYSYGQPTYVATSSTPKVAIGGRGGGFSIPFASSWASNAGADAKVNVFDPTTHLEYEFDGFNGSDKTAYWSVTHNYVTGLADGYPTNGERKGPTGSAMSQVAGMVRISDINSGEIDHALSFITSNPQQGAFRYPASQTDGTRTAANGIQEGMRIQLDPSVDLSKLGLSKGEMMIAKALQKYGAYCSDNGGNNNMAAGFYAEKPTTTADPYPGVGWNQDWAQLSKIPRDKLRVMAASVTPKP